MKYLFTLLFIAVFIFFAKAQADLNFGKTDSIMLSIPNSLTFSTQDIANFINDHFAGDDEKLRAAFFWVASNIRYSLYDKRDFIAADEIEDYIRETLHRRKGKCQAYAEVFHDICQKMGIPSYIVSGLVVPENDKPLATHAWIAAYSTTSWKLYDATFGAGYFVAGKYVKKIDNHYFEANPDTLIQSHYPFDPLWQLKSFPFTMHEFYSGEDTTQTAKPYFNFTDSIREYLALNESEKLASIKRRAMSYGSKTPFLESYLKVIDQQLDYYSKSGFVTGYNQCIENYNRAVKIYNEDFVNINAERLSNKKMQEYHETIARLKGLLEETNELLTNLDTADEKSVRSIIGLKQTIVNMLSNIEIREKRMK